MEEIEAQAQAMISHLIQQRNQALDTVINLIGEIAIRDLRLKKLQQTDAESK